MARWLRYAHAHLRHLFPYLPQQPGYNKRLRAPAIRHCIRVLAAGTSLWTDDVWAVDSTPVESRPRDRQALGVAGAYGYCASHSRWFWGLRLHLVCTLHGLPSAFALAGAKADERQVLRTSRRGAVLPAGPVLIGDKGYYGRDFETALAAGSPCSARPPRRARARRTQYFKPLRQGHRVGQRHLQGPARPRTPRRSHPRRRHRPDPAAHPRPDRRHLAQRHHWPARHAIPDRLRPLTPWNRSSR